MEKDRTRRDAPDKPSTPPQPTPTPTPAPAPAPRPTDEPAPTEPGGGDPQGPGKKP